MTSSDEKPPGAMARFFSHKSLTAVAGGVIVLQFRLDLKMPTSDPFTLITRSVRHVVCKRN